MPEVLEVCDRVVVLRLGRVSGSARIGDVTRAELATMMVGRDVTTPHAPRSAGQGAIRLSVDRLAGQGVGPLTFDIRAGEVLGVAGVDGNGQLELVETLAGLRRATAGSIRLDERELAREFVAGHVDAGLAYMPVDRGQTALVKSMSVAENLMLRDSRRRPFASGAFLSPAGLSRKATALMQAYDIRAPSTETRAASSSGGNQQKIVVAREFDRKPAALIAHQPAWGLDPGATRFVIEQTLALRDAGAAILYVSSELEEVLDVSDRVAVMADGRFVGIDEARQSRSRADRPLDVRSSRMREAAPPGLRPATPRSASLRFVAAEGIGLRIVVAVILSLVCAAALVALSGHNPLVRLRGACDGRRWLARINWASRSIGRRLICWRDRASPSAFALESSTSALRARSLSAGLAPLRSRFTGLSLCPGSPRPLR